MDRVPRRPRFYGRRRGHRLSARQRARVEEVLARYGVPHVEGECDLSTLFPDGRDIWLEVGSGAGEHLVAQAMANPDVGLIGCDPYLNGIATMVRLIEEHGLTNVRIFAEDARLLLPRLASASIARAFLLFPDPWPKKRHHRRRFVQRGNLDLLANVLADHAEFRFASDDGAYCRWALQHVRAHGAFDWTARRASDWCRQPLDWAATRYEEKATATGRSPTFLRFVRRPRFTSEGA